MFRNLGNVFRIRELRNKVLFTIFIIVLYRIGSHIPVMGVKFDALQQMVNALKTGEGSGAGAVSFLDLFSGGALTRFSIFGLGIMPYITASIIIQLLQTVIPRLEQWREDGAVGQKKTTQLTRYVTLVIGLVQSTSLTVAINRGVFSQSGPNPIPDLPPQRLLLIVITMMAGTMLVMWMGELVTERGIGQGMSIIIFANIVAGMPTGAWAIKEAHKSEPGQGWPWFLAAIGVGLVLLVAIVFMESGQRRIPVMFAKRQVGRRMYGGQSSYIPLKVNNAGVIPIIFASSMLYFPVLLVNVLTSPTGWQAAVRNFIDRWLVASSSPVHIALYALLIVGFTYFYNAIQFDPAQQADNIRKQGGYVPGIRPGPPTERYLARILNRITLPGAVFLAAIAVLPGLAFGRSGGGIEGFPFAGTTILIAVGVALETMKQIDSQLMLRNYEGFLQK